MTTSRLPSNLEEVRADLMRATGADARNDAKRRRRVLVVCVAVALIALSGAAAVGAGWLADSDARVVAIRTVTSPTGTTTVAATLGDSHVIDEPYSRADGDIADLQIVKSSDDDSTICIVLNEYATGCEDVTRANTKGMLGWFTRDSNSASTIVYGIAPPGSTAATITAQGHSYRTTLKGPYRAYLIAIPALPLPPAMPNVDVAFTP